MVFYLFSLVLYFLCFLIFYKVFPFLFVFYFFYMREVGFGKAPQVPLQGNAQNIGSEKEWW